MQATGQTSTQAPSLVHSRVMTYGTAAAESAALRGGQGQIGTDHVGHVNPGAILRGRQLPGAIERAQLRRRGQSWRVQLRRRARAVSKLADPGAEHERDEQPVLHRDLTADAARLAWVIGGAYDADDGKGVAGVVGLERGDADQRSEER